MSNNSEVHSYLDEGMSYHPSFLHIFEKKQSPGEEVDIVSEVISTIIDKCIQYIGGKTIKKSIERDGNIISKEFEDKMSNIKGRLVSTLEHNSSLGHESNNFEIIRNVLKYGFTIKDGFLYLYYNNDQSSYYTINLNDPNDNGTYINGSNSNSERVTELHQEIDDIMTTMNEIVLQRSPLFDKALDNDNTFKNNRASHELIEDGIYEIGELGRPTIQSLQNQVDPHEGNLREKGSLSKYEGMWLSNLENKENSLKERLTLAQQELRAREQNTGVTKTTLKSYEERMKLLFGMTQQHEDAAGYFNIAPEEAKIEVSNFLNGRSIENTLKYIVSQHDLIDDNDRQSDVVLQQYSIFFNELYTQLFEQIKQIDNPEESKKYGLELAYYITGRNNMADAWWNPWDEIDIDDNLRNPDFANEILRYFMFEDSHSLKSKITHDLTIEDEMMDGKSPLQIRKECIEKLDGLFEGKENSQYTSEELLIKAGHGKALELIKQQPEISYKNLSIENKISISTLARLSEKLDGHKSIFGEWSEDHGKFKITEMSGEKDIWEGIDMLRDSLSDKPVMQLKSKYIPASELTQEQVLGQIFMEVAQEGIEVVEDEINDNYEKWLPGINSGNYSSEYDLSGTDAAIFDLYQDINGNNGMFDSSDANIGNWKVVGKIGAGLGTALLAAAGAMIWIGGSAVAAGSMYAVSKATGALLTGVTAGKGVLTGTATFVTASASMGTKLSIGGAIASSSITAGAKIGAISSIASTTAAIALSGDGYETVEDAVWESGSDYVINTPIAALGGGAVTHLNKGVAANTALSQTQKNIRYVGSFGGEAAFAGAIPEYLRADSFEYKRKIKKESRDQSDKRDYTSREKEKQKTILVSQLVNGNTDD